MRKVLFVLALIVSCCMVITQSRAHQVVCDGIYDDEDTTAVDTLEEWDYYNPDYDEEYKVKSVAGVEFGSPRSVVLSKLKERFGYSYKENGNVITFYNVNIGGYEYEFANFHFSSRGLCYVELSKHYELSQFEKAKEFRDNIAYSYGRKYKNMVSRVNKETKIIYYLCGMIENFKYPISIGLYKSTSKGGKKFYYVTVDYFNADESVNDDI